MWRELSGISEEEEGIWVREHFNPSNCLEVVSFEPTFKLLYTDSLIAVYQFVKLPVH